VWQPILAAGGLESRMWGKMASCCRLVIGLYESSSTFMGLKGRLHGRKPRPSGSPGLRRGRQFAHQRNCRRVVPRRGFHPLSWAEGPCRQARLPATRRPHITASRLMAILLGHASFSLSNQGERSSQMPGCRPGDKLKHVPRRNHSRLLRRGPFRLPNPETISKAEPMPTLYKT